MGKSTTSYKCDKAVRPDKPSKPYPDFPLTAHNAGYWCKSIRGKLHYFGRWGQVRNGTMERLPGDGWRAALELYQEQCDDLHAGRTPRKSGEGLQIRTLCDKFLIYCDRKVAAGGMQQRTRYEYERTTDRIIRVLGKTPLVADLHPDDFAKLRDDIAKTNGVVAQGSEITRARVVFNFAHKNLLIPSPVQYGLEFARPSRDALRKQRSQKGERMLTPAEIKKLLDAAPAQLRAMILLGINAGLGNTDCGTLPLSAVDLQAGWINYPRPKTGIARRCPLWPETVEAIKTAIAERPRPKHEDATDKVFVTVRGAAWTNGTTANPISAEVCKLLRSAGLYRKGISFYTLRHIFRTVADGTRDHVAVRHIMGHSDDSIDAHYRERIDDHRLLAVADHVWRWLYGADSSKEGASNGQG